MFSQEKTLLNGRKKIFCANKLSHICRKLVNSWKFLSLKSNERELLLLHICIKKNHKAALRISSWRKSVKFVDNKKYPQILAGIMLPEKKQQAPRAWPLDVNGPDYITLCEKIFGIYFEKLVWFVTIFSWYHIRNNISQKKQEALNYSCKKLHLRSSAGFWIRLKVFRISSKREDSDGSVNRFMHFTLRKTAIEQYWVIQHLLKMHSWSYQGLQNPSQPAFTCSKLTIETIQQDVKYVQS